MLEGRIRKLLLRSIIYISMASNVGYLTGCGDESSSDSSNGDQKGCMHNVGGKNVEMVEGCPTGSYCKREMQENKSGVKKKFIIASIVCQNLLKQVMTMIIKFKV